MIIQEQEPVKGNIPIPTVSKVRWLLFRGCLAGIVQCKETLAECSLEMYSQSEDQQADCLSKNASSIIFHCIFASFGLPELNYTALANEALVSDIA